MGYTSDNAHNELTKAMKAGAAGAAPKPKKKMTKTLRSISTGDLLDESMQEFASDRPEPKKKLMKRMWKTNESSQSKPYK